MPPTEELGGAPLVTALPSTMSGKRSGERRQQGGHSDQEAFDHPITKEKLIWFYVGSKLERAQKGYLLHQCVTYTQQLSLHQTEHSNQAFFLHCSHLFATSVTFLHQNN